MNLRSRGAVALVAVCTLVGPVACAGDDDSDGEALPSDSSVAPTLPRPPATIADDGNYLENPGFESVESSWVSFQTPVWARDTETVHSGAASARLPFEVVRPRERPVISSLVQEITTEPFPEKISGWYRVENWQRGAAKQYLQFVVIVFGAENAPTFETWPADAPVNHQVRYPLVGIDAEPFTIPNGAFTFVSRDVEPVEAEWVYFERSVADDFAAAWGEVPRDYEAIRVLFEVRVDEKTDDTVASADVWYDDVFLGVEP